jgi:hypothetical protein
MTMSVFHIPNWAEKIQFVTAIEWLCISFTLKFMKVNETEGLIIDFPLKCVSVGNLTIKSVKASGQMIFAFKLKRFHS